MPNMKISDLLFTNIREKSKDPDNYRVKVFLSIIYNLLISKGIVKKKEIDDLIKSAETAVDEEIKRKNKGD